MGTIMRVSGLMGESSEKLLSLATSEELVLRRLAIDTGVL